MPYQPPSGYKVALTFVNGYEVPAGHKVGLEFSPSGEPVGDKQYLFPTAFYSTSFGEHDAFLFHAFAYPPGWQSSKLSNPSIWNHTQVVRLGGIPSSVKFGRPEVWLWERHIKLEGRGPLTQQFGMQWISHYLRTVIANRPVDYLGWGRPWVVEDPRYINPNPIEPIHVPDKHVVGGLRFIEPVGNEMTEWGARIIPEGQSLYALGRSHAEFGESDVKNHISYVNPQGFNTQQDEALRFGYAHAWNLRQIVAQDYDPNDGLNPPPFGQWTRVENRNRSPQVYGWLSHRFGYQFIWNKAAPIKPSGIPAPENEPFYKAGSVTHGVRSYKPEGIESLVISRWAAIFNTADPVLPEGFDSLDVGTGHSLVNLSRKYSHIGNMDTVALGTPFIADAIRELTFEQRYTIGPPRIELPTVNLYTRYIENTTLGSESLGFGRPALSIHWRIITPRWTFHPPAFIGEPTLRNLTPELRQQGANSEEYGDAFLRTQWREVLGVGDSMQLLGRSIIRDRRHWIEFTGAIPPPAFKGPIVTRIGGLPDNQRILPPTIHSDIWLSEQVGRPIAGAKELYPIGFDPLRTGTPEAKANSIRVEPGIYEHKFGDTWLSLKNRKLEVTKGIEPITDVGKPGITPHTIYAVFESPQQAKDNHPYQELHYVDHDTRTNRSIKGVSSPRISHYHQYIRASGFANQGSGSWWIGRPVIYNAINHINTRGIQAARYGMPAMLPHDQDIEIRAGLDYMSLGSPTIKRPPYTGPQYINGKGFNSLNILALESIEFRDRERNLSGWDSIQMGESKHSDSPYMWQGLRIGPLMPTIPTGFNAELFGEKSWVSHRVRDVSVEGFSTFASEYDFENFDGRMRVWRIAELPVMTLTAAAGFDASDFGYAGLKNKAHHIRPDGNSDQHRKGAF